MDEKRANPKRISGQQQCSSLAIVDGQSKLPFQVVHQGTPVLFPEMHQHLGVGGGAKAMAFLFQLLPKLQVVEDLPVEDGHDRIVFVVDRLATVLQIDDGETLIVESYPGINKRARFVGPSMFDRLTHGGKPGG